MRDLSGEIEVAPSLSRISCWLLKDWMLSARPLQTGQTAQEVYLQLAQGTGEGHSVVSYSRRMTDTMDKDVKRQLAEDRKVGRP